MQTDMVPLRSATLTDHPYGHEGILAGLRKVAEKIQAGRIHDDVISWSGHKLVEAGKPSGNLARAEALFDAFAKQYAYMHDPRGIERMADAQLTLGDGKSKKPRYPGADCDDAVIAYGSACEAAGIPTAIVGAAFGADRAISHVLLMVSDGNGKWVYADPSAKGYKFGQYKTPTREIIIDTLTGEILCDDTMCSPRMAGRVLNDDALGSKFLSLSNEATPPAGAIDVFDLGQPSVRAPLGVLKGLGDVTALSDADRAYLTSVLSESKNALSELRRWFEVGSRACQIVGAPSLGNLPLFGPDDLQRAVNLEAMLEVAIGAWEDVLAGRRTIGLSEGGLFGADLVVESLPSDTVYVGFDLKKRLPELYSIATNDRVNVAKSTLGAFPILGVAIAVAVISVAISGGVAADAYGKAKQAEAAAAQATAQAEYDLVKAGKTDELVKVQQARNLLATEQSKQTVGAQVAQAAQGVGDLAVKGFAAVGLFLLLREGIKAMKGG